MPNGIHFHPYDGDTSSRVWLPLQLSPSRLRSDPQNWRVTAKLSFTARTC
jgi:hypothetical protein